MTFVSFDALYLERLRAGDRATEDHFIEYFGALLNLKLRNRLRSAQLIEDVRQETLLRVVKVVRDGGIEQPERLGAFVHAVCRNVLLEALRTESRHAPLAEDAPEPADARIDIERPLHQEQMRAAIETVLEALPPKDRSILRMLFLQDVPKDEICRRLSVDADYLRVLLHRAKSRFRAEFIKQAGAAALAVKASM